MALQKSEFCQLLQFTTTDSTHSNDIMFPINDPTATCKNEWCGQPNIAPTRAVNPC